MFAWGGDVDGFILIDNKYRRDLWAAIEAFRVPFVTALVAKSVRGGACVGFDNHACDALLANHLLDLGHRGLRSFPSSWESAYNCRPARVMKGAVDPDVRHGLTWGSSASLWRPRDRRGGSQRGAGITWSMAGARFDRSDFAPAHLAGDLQCRAFVPRRWSGVRLLPPHYFGLI